MRNRFVETSNVRAFTAAIARIADRHVGEHTIAVVAGEAGYGKSRTAAWWQVQHDAVRIAVAPGAGRGWVLRDLVTEMSDTPRHRLDDMFHQAVGLVAADPRPIIVDEAEHGLHDGALALDTLRRIADHAEVPLVLIGREGTAEKLRRHRQIWRRIGAIAEFGPIPLEDVALLAEELCEVDVDSGLVAAVHAACEGRICTAIADLARAERAARRAGAERAGPDLVDPASLGHPWARRDARVVGLGGRRGRAAARARQEGAA